MRLNEAIVHCREVAADESRGEKCREEHAQLAIWLEELKVLRGQLKKLTPIEAVIELNKLNDDSAVSCPECGQPLGSLEKLNRKVILPRYCENCGQALDWR